MRRADRRDGADRRRSGGWSGGLSPQGARAYTEILDTAVSICGSERIGADGLWDGICLARLIDFDGDGTPELYYAGAAADGPFFQRLFTYADGKAVQLDIPDEVSNFGTDVSPAARLFVGEGRAYLVDGHEVIMSGKPVTYYTKQGNSAAAALTYTETLGEFPNEAEHICTLDGESISYAGLQAALDDFTAGMTEASYSFWASAGVGESPAGTVAATRQALRTLTNPTAQVSTHRVTVDGKAAAPAAYEINGNNYCKLRDIAQLLRGTAAQFEVTWNGAAQRIDLTDGAGYTSVGGELAALPTGGKAAELTGASVYLDGQPARPDRIQYRGQQLFQAARPGRGAGFRRHMGQRDTDGRDRYGRTLRSGIGGYRNRRTQRRPPVLYCKLFAGLL